MVYINDEKLQVSLLLYLRGKVLKSLPHLDDLLTGTIEKLQDPILYNLN